MEADVSGIRALWRHLSPHLPLPPTDADCLRAIHMARTQANTIPFKMRAYSHTWLMERNLPSALPDKLKPKAERLYPPKAEAVGVMTLSACKGDPIGLGVRRVMTDVVMDYYSTDRMKSPDPEAVKRDMLRQRKEYRRRVADLVSVGWKG
jgi:hypothetical protein